MESVGRHLPHTFEGHMDWVFAVAVTPNGRFVISGAYDGRIDVWDLQQTDLLHAFQGHQRAITELVWTVSGFAQKLPPRMPEKWTRP